MKRLKEIYYFAEPYLMGVALTAAFLFFFYNAWRIMLTVLIAILPIAGIALLVKRK